MPKLDDLLENCTTDLAIICEKLGPKFLRAVVKACGPAINYKDASLVALSDAEEVARLRRTFPIKKLGLKDTEKLDTGLAAARRHCSKRSNYHAVA